MIGVGSSSWMAHHPVATSETESPGIHCPRKLGLFASVSAIQMPESKEPKDREAELEAEIDRVVEEHLKSLPAPSLPVHDESTPPIQLEKVAYDDDIIQEHVYS